MAQCLVRQFRLSARVRPAQLLVAPGDRHGKPYGPKLTRHGCAPRAPTFWLGGFLKPRSLPVCSSRCRFVVRLERRARLDGNGVHFECKALRPYPLPLHGALLSRHDRTGTRSEFEHCFRRIVWMDRIGRSYFGRQQDRVVGYRAGVGEILLVAFKHAFGHATAKIFATRSTQS
jgi:hypothetical protein